MTEPESLLLYQQVARLIESQISTGTLAVGDRAPSVRVLAKRAGVSVATVNQAYLQLEGRGLLTARPRSGFFVASAGRAEPPTPAARIPRRRRPRGVAAEVVDVLRASLGQSDIVGLSSSITRYAGRLSRRLNRLTREVMREDPDLTNRLIAPPGDAGLRRVVARRLGLSGAAVDPDHVVITAGTMEAITLSLGVLCREGDAVLVESPTYFGVLQAVEHLRLRVVEVANRPDSGIDVDAVAAAVAGHKLAAAVLMPNFNNPTGSLTSDADKIRLLQVLGEAAVPVIEDDIHSDLALEGAARPRTLASFGRGSVITCGSVSKTVALGYRVGWAATSDYSGDLARAKFCTSVACPGLQQRVLARYLENGGYDRYLRQLRAEIRRDRDRFRAAIAEYFPAGTRVSNPQGGVVLWVQLPEHVDGLALFHHALAKRIGIAPGLIFSAKAGYRNYIRLAMGAGWSPRIQQALQRLGELVARTTRDTPV